MSFQDFEAVMTIFAVPLTVPTETPEEEIEQPPDLTQPLIQ